MTSVLLKNACREAGVLEYLKEAEVCSINHSKFISEQSLDMHSHSVDTLSQRQHRIKDGRCGFAGIINEDTCEVASVSSDHVKQWGVS